MATSATPHDARPAAVARLYPVLHDHHPGGVFPTTTSSSGGGQDSGQARVEDDLAIIAPRLRGSPPPARRC